MPPSIHQRCRPDGVAEFRAAAVVRFEDGVLLAAGSPDRWLAAVYLWGYSVEMVLKAAVFDLLGNAAAQPITGSDLKAVQQLARAAAGFTWAGNLHQLDLWATLLVRCRWQLTGLAYADPARGRAVIARARRVYGWWREGLRYHVVMVEAAELAAAREQAEWFITHADTL